MPKLKIFLVISLVILGMLIGFTILKPMATGEEYSETQREQLLQSGDGYILQFDIMNHEGKETEYTINVTVDGESSTLTVPIQGDRAFTYIKHINRDMLAEGGTGTYTPRTRGDDT